MRRKNTFGPYIFIRSTCLYSFIQEMPRETCFPKTDVSKKTMNGWLIIKVILLFFEKQHSPFSLCI